jgi:hypothetical protein
MKWTLLALGLLASSPVFADSRCVSLRGLSLNNDCEKCVEVTVRELGDPQSQSGRAFTGVTRKVRLEGLEGRQSEQLQGQGNWLIGAIADCR